MASNKELHAFAQKWLAIWKKPEVTERELDSGFGDDCLALGMEMDAGRAFEKLYSKEAFLDAASFLAIADRIQDASVLTSALFSHWRFVTHWSNQDLSDEKNKAWFIAALSRLAELTATPGR